MEDQNGKWEAQWRVGGRRPGVNSALCVVGTDW